MGHPIWQGKIHVSTDCIQIDNCIMARRTVIIPKSDCALRFVGFCASTSRVFIISDDNAVSELKEVQNGWFLYSRLWSLDSSSNSYCMSGSINESITITNIDLGNEMERFSHFGLSVVTGSQPDTAIIDHPSIRIACTESHLYIAHSSERPDQSVNRVTQIDLDTGAATEFNDFLQPGVGIQVMKCGFAHAVLVDSLGFVFTFRIGTRGELGHGDLESQTKPTIVQALAGVRVRKIAVGGWHTVAVTEFGDAYVWGWNNDGQLGFDKELVSSLAEPKHLEFSNDVAVAEVACGSRHTVFLLENDELYGCGWNGYGQLGDGLNSETYPLRILQSRKMKIATVTKLDAAVWTTSVHTKL